MFLSVVGGLVLLPGHRHREHFCFCFCLLSCRAGFVPARQRAHVHGEVPRGSSRVGGGQRQRAEGERGVLPHGQGARACGLFILFYIFSCFSCFCFYLFSHILFFASSSSTVRGRTNSSHPPQALARLEVILSHTGLVSILFLLPNPGGGHASLRFCFSHALNFQLGGERDGDGDGGCTTILGLVGGRLKFASDRGPNEPVPCGKERFPVGGGIYSYCRDGDGAIDAL